VQIPLVQFYCEKVGPDDVTHLRIASKEFEDDDEAVNEINPSSEPDVHGGRRLRLRDRYGNTAPVRCECDGHVRQRCAGAVHITEIDETKPVTISEASSLLDKFKAKFAETFGGRAP
jgi:hypothetical protein